MKKAITALTLSIIVGTGSLYAHGKEKHTEDMQMQNPVASEGKSESMGGMDPKMMQRMQGEMREAVIRIVRSELEMRMQQKMSAEMESAIREKLKKAMQKMRQKAQKKMQEKGMQGKGMMQRKRGMAKGRTQGSMGRGMMGQETISKKMMQKNKPMQGAQGKIEMH